MNSLIIEGLLYAGLFLGGFTFLTLLTGWSRLPRNLCAALPVGYGLWAICWIPFGLAYADQPGHISVALAAASFTLLVALFTFFALRDARPAARAAWIASATMTAMACAGVGYGQHFGYFVSGDSFYMCTWHVNPRTVLVQGFALPNLAIANLSRCIQPGYYMFPVHVLMTLSLLALMGESIFYHAQRHGRAWWTALPAALLIPAVLAASSMFILQAVYINHHIAFAFFLLLYLTLAFEDRPAPVLAAFCLFMLTMLRTEGLLFALFALLCHGGMPLPKSAETVWAVAKRFFPVVAPYGLFLTAIYQDDGFVSPRQYMALLLVAATVFGLLRLRAHPQVAYLLRHAWSLALLGTVTLLAALTIIRPAYMVESLSGFVLSTFDPSIYGYAHHVLAVCTFYLIIIRTARRTGWTPMDLFCVFYFSSMLLIPALSFFDVPCPHDFRSTASRITVHFLPIGFLWVGYMLTMQPGTGTSHQIKDRSP